MRLRIKMQLPFQMVLKQHLAGIQFILSIHLALYLGNKMSHFAKIENNIVVSVIVADADFINSGLVGDPFLWVQTSYNTRGGIYYTPNTNDPDSDQSKAFRKNYAGIGFTYDANRDAFIPPQPYPSWTLDEFSCLWAPPIPMPDDGLFYRWNETTQTWDLCE